MLLSLTPRGWEKQFWKWGTGSLSQRCPVRQFGMQERLCPVHNWDAGRQVGMGLGVSRDAARQGHTA